MGAAPGRGTAGGGEAPPTSWAGGGVILERQKSGVLSARPRPRDSSASGMGRGGAGRSDAFAARGSGAASLLLPPTFPPKNTGVPEMVAGFGFEAQSRRHQWEGWMGSWASCGLEVVDFFKKTSFPPLVNLIKEVIE